MHLFETRKVIIQQFSLHKGGTASSNSWQHIPAIVIASNRERGRLSASHSEIDNTQHLITPAITTAITSGDHISDISSNVSSNLNNCVILFDNRLCSASF